ncbi:MAG: GGDEF domain-containing protein [Magnetococcus sp. DMHC-6]
MANQREIGKSFAKGAIILRQGENSNCMYIVQKGSAEMILETQQGEHSLKILKEGDMFGEVSLFAGKAHYATVRAVTTCRVLKVDEKTFMSKLHQDPSMTFRMIKKMACRIYEQDHDWMRAYYSSDSSCQATGFASFIDLTTFLDGEVKRAKQLMQSLAFVILDIDDFKVICQRFGDEAGQDVLKGVADVLREHLRQNDIIGRFGDDRFGIILYEAEGLAAVKVMTKVLNVFTGMHFIAGQSAFQATFSCGIAIFPEHKKADQLSKSAFEALARGKRDAGKQVILAPPDSEYIPPKRTDEIELAHTPLRRGRHLLLFGWRGFRRS